MEPLPFQLPTQVGEELFSRTIQASPQVRLSIGGLSLDGSAPHQSVIDAAEALVSEHQHLIRGYALGQRQNAELSGLPVYGHETAFPGGSLRYTNLAGSETLQITVEASVVAPPPPPTIRLEAGPISTDLGEEGRRRQLAPIEPEELLAVQFEAGAS